MSLQKRSYKQIPQEVNYGKCVMKTPIECANIYSVPYQSRSYVLESNIYNS